MTSDALAATTSGFAGLQVAPDEMVFFQDGNAFISNLRCAFKGDIRIYAASGITSAGISSTSQKWGAFVFLGIIAFVAGVGNSTAIATFCAILAVLFRIAGRPKHYLSLHTSGLSYLPLWSKNRDYIGTMVAAINNVILARG